MQFIKVPFFVTNYGVVAIADKIWDGAGQLWNGFWDVVTVEPEETVQGTQIVGRFSESVFDMNWAELINGNSHIYEAVVKVSLVIATTLIGFWAIPWINTLINEGYSQKTIDELVFPLIVVLMLAINNGYVLSNINLLFRDTTNYIRNQILTETTNGISYEQMIREENWTQVHKLMFSNEIRKCRLLSNNQESEEDGKAAEQACANKAREKVRQQAEAEGVRVENLLATGLATLINPFIDMILFTIFTTMEAGFVITVELCFLLNAYISPLFLVLSLLPGQSKLIHAWLSGWLALALVKISYSLVVGMAASGIANTGDTGLLILPLIQGILSPALAMAIGGGGGMAFFNTLSSAAVGSLRFGLKLAMGMIK